MNGNDIVVSAVVLRDERGRLLTVRKRGTARFMLPGGKPEPGETPEQTAVRETAEEVGVTLDPGRLRLIGTFTTEAANEPDRVLVSTVYEHPLDADVAPAGEIDELRWLDVDAHPLPDDLAPLLTDAVLPALDRRIRAVTVFTGARDGASPRYAEQARELGAALARAGLTVVFGGGKAGLMGAVADGALAAGGRVVGVIPQHLVDAEIAHTGLTRLEVVTTMHERKARMTELCDAFVALPGGGGTLDELFEAWTWQQLGLHAKPVALYDTEFWAPLTSLFDHLVAQGFVDGPARERLVTADDPATLLDRLEAWTPPRPRWER